MLDNLRMVTEYDRLDGGDRTASSERKIALRIDLQNGAGSRFYPCRTGINPLDWHLSSDQGSAKQHPTDSVERQS